MRRSSERQQCHISLSVVTRSHAEIGSGSNGSQEDEQTTENERQDSSNSGRSGAGWSGLA